MFIQERCEPRVIGHRPKGWSRRRTFLMRRRSELLTHVQLVNHQYNLDPFEKRLQYAANRDVVDRFTEVSARHNVAADLEMISHYDKLLQRLELNILPTWTCRNHNLNRSRNQTTASIPRLLAPNPSRQRSPLNPSQHQGAKKKDVKEPKQNGTLPLRSLDFVGHIGVMRLVCSQQ